MKKVGIIIFALALVVGLVVSNLFSFGRVTDKFFNFSFDFKGVKGSGQTASEVRGLTGFRSVDVGGVFEVVITTQKDFAVEVEADDNLLPLIKTEVRGDVLTIGTEQRISPRSPIRVRISAPDIDELDVSGVANVTIKDLKNTGLSVDGSGASKVTIAGQTSKLTVDVSGATKVYADDLATENATTKASGASHIYVNVSGTLRADASGASHIVYSGSPTRVEKDASGASKILPKQ